MNNTLYSILGIIIPLIGTSIGSCFVIFVKNNINKKLQSIIIGFAAGVMIAASIWSLIIPSTELSEKQGIIQWIPASVGFIFGVIFLILTNEITSRISKSKNKEKFNMIMFSVTLHNIPEGMAVRCLFCRIFIRKCRDSFNCRNDTCNWYCTSKYT